MESNDICCRTGVPHLIETLWEIHTFQENTETCMKEKEGSGGKQTDTVKNYV